MHINDRAVLILGLAVLAAWVVIKHDHLDTKVNAMAEATRLAVAGTRPHLHAVDSRRT